MKVKCEVIVDTDTGSYSIEFNNLSSPSEDVDYNDTIRMLYLVLKDFHSTVNEADIDDSKITRLIH
jgi:hypothetical protein